MAPRKSAWLTRAGIAMLMMAVAIALVIVKKSGPSDGRTADAIVLKKGAPGGIAQRKNSEAAIGANEERGADATPGVEAYLQRAYPSDEVSMDATLGAQNAWAALKAGPSSPGSWELIGPSKATYPGVLNALGDGAQYIAAGRVTAMAIGASCVPSDCPIYVGAAGGGIWRARDALTGNPKWEFVSGSFATNAIGSLVRDPNDLTGRTLYAGTGEPNISADSEAGMGIYKTTDGGDTWTLLAGSAQFQGRAVASLAITSGGDILAAVARAVRGVSSVSSGGATSNPPGGVPFGVYKSSTGGTTFTNAFNVSAISARGVNEVRVDPNNGAIYYASVLQQGVWRSSNSGATWTQMKAPLNPGNNTDRAEFALANDSGTTRMYVGIGASGGVPARFYRANNAQTATNAGFVDMTTPQNVNYCTAQCWYDNVVESPAGNPDIVYLLGSFSYAQLQGASNGRAVLLSTDGGATWSDLTQDGDPHEAEFTHPDQHAIVFNPTDPFQYWEGSDGGVVRSDGNFADVSYKCDDRGLDAATTAYCRSLLARVPNQLVELNEGFSTLQFQSLSVSAKRPKNNVQGGTQDNGTFQYTGSPIVWNQEIYGDGGQSGFSSSDDRLRFNTFFGQASDVNFRDGDPTRWVVATGPIVASPEGSYFYPPIINDPHPARGGTIFQGSFSVWRTQDWGGPRDYLEANCPEFTTSAANPACGDFVRIGPPGATDLRSAVYGTRAGGAVAVIERVPSNTSTLWAATGTGRVFVSTNADAPASAVVWIRIDTLPGAVSDPARFPSSIHVDPANPNHAWISYSGYNITTPAQPGHIFEVTWTGGAATWTDRSYNLQDLPITDLVRDDVTGDLYAASDFGVMRLANASTTWTVAGSGLPMVEVPGLTIVPGARLLYAATHGRSAWVLQLP